MDNKITKAVKALRRVSVELCVLLSVFMVAVMIPSSYFSNPTTNFGLLAIFMQKGMLVSAGLLHGLIARKLLFPYVDLKKESPYTGTVYLVNHILTSIAAVFTQLLVLYCWARGG